MRSDTEGSGRFCFSDPPPACGQCQLVNLITTGLALDGTTALVWQMIVFLTTSDTDILTLDRVRFELPSGFGETLALNPFVLVQDEGAFEQFLNDTLSGADIVLARLLGGDRAMGDRFSELELSCREKGIPLVACSGEPVRDAVFERRSTTPAIVAQTAFEYLNHGGVSNLGNLLRFLSDEIQGTDYGYGPPVPLPQDGVYRPGRTDAVPLDEYRRLYCDAARPTVAVLFYRAHWVSQNVEFVEAMVDALEDRGCNALPVFCSSLREDDGAVFRKYLMDSEGQAAVDVVVCTQSFAMSQNRGPHVANSSDENWDVAVLERLDVPILQAIVTTEPQAMWEERDIGLSPLDTAMSVALPELDGRIITVPVSFKESVSQNGAGSGELRRYIPNVERTESVAALAARYAKLRGTPVAERKVAIVLSNYPTKASRLGNAVGLDTPASAINLLLAMRDAGYTIEDIPSDGDELMRTAHRALHLRRRIPDSRADEKRRGAGERSRVRRTFRRYSSGRAGLHGGRLGESAGQRVRRQRPPVHGGSATWQRVCGHTASSRVWGESHRHLPQP